MSIIYEGEKKLLERVAGGEPMAEKILIEKYLKLVFGFVSSYASFSREQAFDITVSSMAVTLNTHTRISKDGMWMQALFREMMDQCAKTRPLGRYHYPTEPLKTILLALFRLTPSDRNLILLRDQCRFSFEAIGWILRVNSQECRISCLSARERLRERVQAVILDGGEDGV